MVLFFQQNVFQAARQHHFKERNKACGSRTALCLNIKHNKKRPGLSEAGERRFDAGEQTSPAASPGAGEPSPGWGRPKTPFGSSKTTRLSQALAHGRQFGRWDRGDVPVRA